MKTQMEAFEQYSLINQKRWTEFLNALEVGVHTFVFPTIADIKSCKARGYDLNSDRLGRIYTFETKKQEKIVTITVKAV